MAKRLSAAFAKLNAEQKAAVCAEHNTAVLAGPGSGKTATLVVKVGHLLSEVVKAPSGLACLTFNKEAANEFTHRLRELGFFSGRRMFLGTVHSFCLNCVIRPYGPLFDERYSEGVLVAGDDQAKEFLETALKKHAPHEDLRWAGPRITAIRRAIACNEDITGFADSDVLVAREYDDILLNQRLIDFEGMVTGALSLITSSPEIRDLIASRFPWIIVDEYQDLGGALHKIVTTLIDEAGVNVFVVGDPDQTIYDFTGAKPVYLQELVDRKDFETFRLKFNYRSGQRIIDASQAALAPQEPRGYVTAPGGSAQGEVSFLEVEGAYTAHAKAVVGSIVKSVENGTPYEEIAVFYRGNGLFVDAIVANLKQEDVPFLWERDEQFPHSYVNNWLQKTAAWCLFPTDEREYTFDELFGFYETLLASAGSIEPSNSTLTDRIRFYELLSKPVTRDMSLNEWLVRIVDGLSLMNLLSASEEFATDNEKLEQLMQCVTDGGTQHQTRLSDFASFGKVKGKVIVTTLHGSKGRQFDTVIIPGCAEGELPRLNWNRRSRSWDEPPARQMAETRRLFYVGLSRAKKQVVLISSETFPGRYNHVFVGGVSRFVSEIKSKLNQAE